MSTFAKFLALPVLMVASFAHADGLRDASEIHCDGQTKSGLIELRITKGSDGQYAVNSQDAGANLSDDENALKLDNISLLKWEGVKLDLDVRTGMGNYTARFRNNNIIENGGNLLESVRAALSNCKIVK